MVRMRASDPMRVRRLAIEGLDALVAASLGDKREAVAVDPPNAHLHAAARTTL